MRNRLYFAQKGTWLNNMVEEKNALPIEIEEEPA